MFIVIFQDELFFLDEKYIDDELSQKIIQHIPNIKNIVHILNKSEDYVSYIKKINDNFEDIFKAISPLKSLKGIFKADSFLVSQKDDIKEFVKIHAELINKQEAKRKFFISFFKMFKQYYSLYSEYNNLDGLCELLTMLLLESNKFQKRENVSKLKTDTIIKIRDLLKQKIDYKEISGKDIIKVLIKIKDVFNDEYIFDFKYKTSILNYFIEKFKENDQEIIKEYKVNKISELFRNPDIKKNILLITLKNEAFDTNNDLIDLLPDELNNDELDIITNLLKNIIEKSKSDEINDENTFFSGIFKRVDLFHILQKIKANDVKILNLIVGFVNKNDEKLYEEITNYLNDKYFKINVFFVDINHIQTCIPIYIFQKMKNENGFIEVLLKNLSNYIIDEDTIFSFYKNHNFLLLEEIYANNYFLFDYQQKTIEFINKSIERRAEYSYNNIMKIVNNFNNNMYDKVKNILTEEQYLDLKSFYNDKISSDISYIESLEKIHEFLFKLYPLKAERDICKLQDYIDKLKMGKINEKEKYKNEINNLRNKYQEKRDKYIKYSFSKVFMNFFYLLENEDKNQN